MEERISWRAAAAFLHFSHKLKETGFPGSVFIKE